MDNRQSSIVDAKQRAGRPRSQGLPDSGLRARLSDKIIAVIGKAASLGGRLAHVVPEE